jgi:spectinomycin phosphotransferase/16S rRNA (guanine(1405)-N(7))-methyltransferase
VVAPVPARDGAPLVRAGDGFGVALYPFIDGLSFEWGDFRTHAHRLGVLDLIVAVHMAPRAAGRRALADDFAIPSRDALELAIAGTKGDVAPAGPYALAALELISGAAAPIARMLARYDDLVATCRAGPPRTVLTHGEPHPGNTMRTASGWLLIDWDTVLLAPPERDLWDLDPGDGSVLAAYAGATGVTPLPSMLELYRIRWDLADLCADFSRLRGPHAGSEDDQMCWDILRSLVARIGERASR